VVKLTSEAQARARAYVTREARPLERALLGYCCGEGGADDVLAALGEYQNADGGFGHGLEPDVRLPSSSVLATTIALQILRDLEIGPENALVHGAVRYLAASYDLDRGTWPIVPPDVDSAPHAPWWNYSEDDAWWAGMMANPRAEVAGYLLDYAELVPAGLVDRVTRAVEDDLDDMVDTMTMHDLLCYARYVQTRSLPRENREVLLEKLWLAADRLVVVELEGWGSYGLEPLILVGSPGSPFAARLSEAIERNLDYRIATQDADGAWSPVWSWGGAHPEAWREAEREWKGMLTVEALRQLGAFGRLA